jgi:hypothetical protein
MDNFDFYAYTPDSDFSFLKPYECVFVLWGSAQGLAMVKKIRQSTSAKLLFHGDDELTWDATDASTKGIVARSVGCADIYRTELLPYVDAVLRSTVKQWDFPNYLFSIPRTYNSQYIKKEKKEYVAIMHHFMTNPSSAIEVVNKLGLKAKIFSGMIHTKIEQTKGYLLACGVPESALKDHILMTSLNGSDYMSELSECRYGIEDAKNYLCFSRFVYECGLVGIPAISNNLIMSANIGFPELATAPFDQQAQMALIRRLQTDKEFYDGVITRARENFIKYSSEENCTNLMIAAIRGVGVKI